MKIITLDFETFYDKEYTLSKMTTEEYINDERFEVIGVSVQVDNDPPEWFSGPMRTTGEWLSTFPWDNSIGVAHNAMFDMAILNWHFGIRPKKIADTLSMSRALHGTEVGGSLAKMAAFYNLGEKGTEILNALGKRRLDFTRTELTAYGQYCKNDTALTYKLFAAMAPEFPVSELELIDITTRMFTEPVLELDKSFLETQLQSELINKRASLSAVRNGLLKIEESMEDISDERIKKLLMSNTKFAQLLEMRDVVPPKKVSPTTGKEIYAFAKTDEAMKELEESDDWFVRGLVAARLGHKSTLLESRLERFIAIAGRGSMPVPLRYYAAHTGRWGGADKINLQNLPRGSVIKHAICAPDGHYILDYDSGQIEARMLAWLAEQDDLVETFFLNNREVAQGVPKAQRQHDPYKIMATKIYGIELGDVDDDQRFIGKTTILGCIGVGTRVLCDSGWKLIEQVSINDKLWDGEEFVCHQGLVQKGLKETLNVCGSWLTPDHKILCGTEWQESQLVVRDGNILYQALERGAEKLPLQATLRGLEGESEHLLLNAIVGALNTLSTNITLKLLGLRAATYVRNRPVHQHVNSTGSMRALCPTMHIEQDYLTAFLLQYQDAITKTTPDIAATVVEVLQCIKNGETTEQSSLNTLLRLKAGITQTLKWIGLIMTGGMSQTTFGSSVGAKTCEINDGSRSCRRQLMTYDISYAGPRNRFTILTNDGPLIVHNCGYGMGKDRFKDQLRTQGVDITLTAAEHTINVYRNTYTRITDLWRRAGDILHAIANNQYTEFGRNGVLKVEGQKGIRLPNGLYLKYPNLRQEYDDDGRPQWYYDVVKGRGVVKTKIYGGKVVENCCQALARIVIADQMRMIAKKYRPVMTVHDAIAVIAPIEDGDRAKDWMEMCMRIAPEWCRDLPLDCEGGIGKTYGDCKA